MRNNVLAAIYVFHEMIFWTSIKQSFQEIFRNSEKCLLLHAMVEILSTASSSKLVIIIAQCTSLEVKFCVINNPHTRVMKNTLRFICVILTNLISLSPECRKPQSVHLKSLIFPPLSLSPYLLTIFMNEMNRSFLHFLHFLQYLLHSSTSHGQLFSLLSLLPILCHCFSGFFHIPFRLVIFISPFSHFYRSFQHWYNNPPPEAEATTIRVVHVWPGEIPLSTDGAPAHVAQRIMDIGNAMSEAVVPSVQVVSEWLSDQVAPEYWTPNAEAQQCRVSCNFFSSDSVTFLPIKWSNENAFTTKSETFHLLCSCNISERRYSSHKLFSCPARYWKWHCYE